MSTSFQNTFLIRNFFLFLSFVNNNAICEIFLVTFYFERISLNPFLKNMINVVTEKKSFFVSSLVIYFVSIR